MTCLINGPYRRICYISDQFLSPVAIDSESLATLMDLQNCDVHDRNGQTDEILKIRPRYLILARSRESKFDILLQQHFWVKSEQVLSNSIVSEWPEWKIFFSWPWFCYSGWVWIESASKPIKIIIRSIKK